MPINVRLRQGTDEPHADLLLRVAFNPAPSQQSAAHERVVHTGLRPLDAVLSEDWLSATAVTCGRCGSFHYAHNHSLCFGWLYFDADDPIEMATYTAYATARRFFEQLGFAHWLRAWHYLPGIRAQGVDDLCYRNFCRGRFTALQEFGHPSYCAATVIGTQATFGVMYFLTAQSPGVAVENPRQTSAWQYPVAAASERPLFARAVTKTWNGKTHFYVSGTAGIVGHESQHAGDTAAQLREALVNLRTLLDETQVFRGVERVSGLKVYLSNTAEVGVVRTVLAEASLRADSLALLEGEICRAELRVEIEALIV